jgi:SEC-C motif-containing protein
MNKLIHPDQHNNPCPCGTNKPYLNCCGLFISNKKLPSTPEELMRSRYTAYNLINVEYIRNTMKSPAADNFNAEEAEKWAQTVTWLGLEVLKTKYDSTKGSVEFSAYYSIGSKKEVLHEISQFHFEDGKWYYVDGTHTRQEIVGSREEKIGRNEMCSCGNNKKYKKCCGK